MALLSRSSLDLIKIVIIFIPSLMSTRDSMKHMQVLLQNILYQDYQQGSAKTVIRVGRTNSTDDIAEQYNGPAERVEVKVEQTQVPPGGGGRGPKVPAQGMAPTPQFVTPMQEAPGVLFDPSFQQNQPITLPDGTKFTPKRVNTSSEYGQMWRGYSSGGDDGSFELNIETGRGAVTWAKAITVCLQE